MAICGHIFVCAVLWPSVILSNVVQLTESDNGVGGLTVNALKENGSRSVIMK